MSRLFAITAHEKHQAALRELAMRRSVYPRRVEDKKMSQVKADEQIAVMEAIAADYEQVAAFDRPLITARLLRCTQARGGGAVLLFDTSLELPGGEVGRTVTISLATTGYELATVARECRRVLAVVDPDALRRLEAQDAPVEVEPGIEAQG